MIGLPDEDIARRIPDAPGAIDNHGSDRAGLAAERDDRTLDHSAGPDADETIATDADKKVGIDAEGCCRPEPKCCPRNRLRQQPGSASYSGP